DRGDPGRRWRGDRLVRILGAGEQVSMRVYFASDIHASDRCWLKFLATPKFYAADVIIIGGDITGKFIVPIIQRGSGKWSASLHGVERQVGSPEELEALKKQLGNSGSYYVEMAPDEYAAYKDDQPRIDTLFKQLVMERAARWVELADTRLQGQPVR